MLCFHYRASSSSILYSIAHPYKSLSTINSQIALVVDNITQTPSSPVIGAENRSDSRRYLLNRPQHQRIPIEYTGTSLASPIRGTPFEFRDTTYGGKKKDNETPSTTVSNEAQNVHVFEVDTSGKMELIASFSHNRGTVLCVDDSLSLLHIE